MKRPEAASEGARAMKRTEADPVRFLRPIVVGVGADPIAEHVVRAGEELGRRLAVDVHRVHAVPKLPDVWPGLDPARGDALTTELLDRARRSVEDRVRPILADSEDARTKRLDGAVDAKGRRGGAAVAETALVDVVPGHPAEVLLDESRRLDAGLLVLGAHAKRSLFDFGNTLRAVYAKSTIPVWTQPGRVAPIRRILAAVDLSEDSLRALGAACDLAKVFGAEVRAVFCFHVVPPAIAGDPSHGVIDFPFEDVIRSERVRFAQAMKEFDWQGVPHDTEFVEVPPHEGLLERARSADLVVLGTHGRTGLASVVLGGVAYSILKRSPKPTLVVPHGKRSFRIDS
jgi:nucleotide-binding universal stress UspA family protein